MRVFTNLHFLTLYTVVYDNAIKVMWQILFHICALIIYEKMVKIGQRKPNIAKNIKWYRFLVDGVFSISAQMSSTLF